jgi:hypothetical protein
MSYKTILIIIIVVLVGVTYITPSLANVYSVNDYTLTRVIELSNEKKENQSTINVKHVGGPLTATVVNEIVSRLNKQAHKIDAIPLLTTGVNFDYGDLRFIDNFEPHNFHETTYLGNVTSFHTKNDEGGTETKSFLPLLFTCLMLCSLGGGVVLYQRHKNAQHAQHRRRRTRRTPAPHYLLPDFYDSLTQSPSQPVNSITPDFPALSFPEKPCPTTTALAFQCEICKGLLPLSSKANFCSVTCQGCGSPYVVDRGYAFRLTQGSKVQTWGPIGGS